MKRILCYEVLLETEIAVTPDRLGFRPNVFVDITDYLDRKIEIMKIYQRDRGFSLPAERGGCPGFVSLPWCCLRPPGSGGFHAAAGNNMTRECFLPLINLDGKRENK